ncbi:CinA family protein [Pedobacter sp. JY14-1]|uniref:CinA family protein n=1 Tax=Pedobacter sp. JY14-1 TaxID=3034151 RepID=UPI0023E2BCCA|nr:CinA family protein [Pedobacter sp. JY14-1]
MKTDTLTACAKLLIENKLTIAFAESATAGRIAADFSLQPDAGKFLKGGIVCYDACLKSDLLKVPQELIDTHTPESMEVTQAIASGLAGLIPADIHLGVTGLPAPGGSETEEKPVGTMFICGMLGERSIFSDRAVFEGSPEEIVQQTVAKVAVLIIRFLSAKAYTNNLDQL